METSEKKNNCFDSDILYWSPVVHWRIKNEHLCIGMKRYERKVVESLFPEIYFYTQQGVSRYSLIKEFESIAGKEIEKIIDLFIADRVLVTSILDIEELFSSQTHLLKHEYGMNLLIDKASAEIYKAEQLQREVIDKADKEIKFDVQLKIPNNIKKRQTVREFNDKRLVGYMEFTQILGVFKQEVKDNGNKKYYYASAGGLYPIDIYVFVKSNRVEAIPKGLYYYNPIKNSLMCLSEDVEISVDAQYFSNKGIYLKSAFTVYFVYNAKVSMPRYGGGGYQYALIDTGIMVSTMNFVCEELEIGMCSIGTMNYKAIIPFFHLESGCKIIHSVEVGLKPYQYS